MNKLNVPLCEKLRKLIEENQHAKWFIQNGVKYLVKRKLFENFLNEVTVI